MSETFIPIGFPKGLPLPEGGKLLAADVGGTKTDVGLFEIKHGKTVLLQEVVFPSKKFDSLTEVIRHFRLTSEQPDRLCVAFAGPVQDGKAKATNLGWSIDIHQLQRELGIPVVFLINDLEAEGYGLAALSEEDIKMIYLGEGITQGNAAILAPGTGLGEAGLFWDGAAFRPFATEGGHADFAPRIELDCELMHYLQKKYGHVSWERVVSGPGICSIFSFLRDIHKWEVPTRVTEQMKIQDPATAVGQAAAECVPICEETIRLFIRYLAIEASCLALKLKATSGLFLGGGILPKIWNESLRSIFMRNFLDVGRLRPLLETVPVHLILNQKTALLGAAYYGAFSGTRAPIQIPELENSTEESWASP